MTFRVILEHDPEAVNWSVISTELPSEASFGRTDEEALQNLREAMALHLTPSAEDAAPTT